MSEGVVLNKEGTSVEKASTPEPVGPAPLWKKKGWKLPSYIEHVANDLKDKRGMDESRAIATAIAVVKRWAAGGGKVTADTRAAAQKAVSEWEAKKAGTGGELSDEQFVDQIMNFDAPATEGGVDLAQPGTNITRLQGIKASVLEWMKDETDPYDIREGRSWLESISRLIARDQGDRATGQRGTPSYFSDGEPRWVAELFFEDGDGTQSEEGDLIWKPILREGKWKLSPGPGQAPANKPITVIKDGKSDPAKLVISMSELLKNFKAGAVEHVAVPASHDNKVLENTGFIRDLRLGKDAKGRWTLEAAHDFTEPEVKMKAQRGTIANTSAGVLFDYPRKEDGKKFNAVLEHVALTNRPWLNGMKPFGMAADAEEVTVMSFSEDGAFSDEELEALMAETPEVVEDAGAAADLGADGTKLAEEPEEVEVEEPEEGAEVETDLADNPPFGSAAWDAKYGKKGAKGKGKEEKSAEEKNEDEPPGAPEKEPDADDKSGAKKKAKMADAGKTPDKPYGDVTYADPGYQKDGQKRYPLDSETHIRAAWAYINKTKNAAAYSSGQLSKVKARIRVALKKLGANVEMSDELLTQNNESALRALAFTDRKEDIVPDDVQTDTDAFIESFGLSEEEVRDALAERDSLKLGDRERRVKDQIQAWEADKKSPAILVIAEKLLMSDPGTVALHLSDDGDEKDRYGKPVAPKAITLSEAIEMLVNASGEVKLEDKKVTEAVATKGEEPLETDVEVKLSAEVEAEARRLFLYEQYTQDDALEAAKAKFGSKEEVK